MPFEDARALADAAAPTSELRVVHAAGHGCATTPGRWRRSSVGSTRQLQLTPTAASEDQLGRRGARRSSTSASVSSSVRAGVHPVVGASLVGVADERRHLDRPDECRGR